MSNTTSEIYHPSCDSFVHPRLVFFAAFVSLNSVGPGNTPLSTSDTQRTTNVGSFVDPNLLTLALFVLYNVLDDKTIPSSERRNPMSSKGIKPWLSSHKGVIFSVIFDCLLLVTDIYFSSSSPSSDKIDATYKEQLIDGNNMLPPCPTSVTSSHSSGTAKSPHDVSRHIRNLGDGRQASSQKRESAAVYGIILAENQTWVAPYSTGKILN